MLTIVICCLAFIGTLWTARRSLGLGLLAVAATGYCYGILRANLLHPASHFIFDASLSGLYVAYGAKLFSNTEFGRTSAVRIWAIILIGWPCLISMLPFQPLLVSLVGLRGNVLFLPLLLIGSRLKDRDLRQFTFGIAALNLVALAFGMAEYFRGIEPFFPRSPVTMIMYSSSDVAGGNYRIPSLFTSAHAYAGTMVCTLPFLFGAWSQRNWQWITKLILLLGMIAALCGVLLASTRSFVVMAVYVVIIATLSSRVGMRKRILWVCAILLVGVLALTNERFHRFKTLGDSELVMNRVAGSVNRKFFEILFEYPMGNGLGGGGTSMPYFLQDSVRHPIGIENEYSRILSEQGVIGLSIWIGFIVWSIVRRSPFVNHPWLDARRLIWYLYALMFPTSVIGTGLLSSIPGTFFLILGLGWAIVVPDKEQPKKFSSAIRGRRQLTPIYVR